MEETDSAGDSMFCSFLFKKKSIRDETVIRPSHCPFVAKKCIGAQCDFHPENPRNGYYRQCPIVDILEAPRTFKQF